MGLETLEDIMRLLQYAGYKKSPNCPSDDFVCIFDPTCVWPPLLEFINTAWVIIAVITGFLLAGWGITMIRGARHDMVKNIRDLVLMFGILAAAPPIISVLGGDDAIIKQCKTIEIPFSQIQSWIQENSGKKFHDGGYEIFEIQDSNFQQDTDITETYLNETFDIDTENDTNF